METKNDLFEGNDFFKNHQLAENGHVLRKSIPTMPRSSGVELAAVSQKPKEVPASVKTFKKEVEGLFDRLDSIVKDMKDEMSEWDSTYFCESYWNFKKSFQQKINSIIQYPMSPETKERIKKENESKIQITR